MSASATSGNKAGNDGVENQVYITRNGIDDHLVGSDQTDPDDTQTGRNNDRIRLQTRHIPDPVQHQRLCLIHHRSGFFFCQRFHIFFQQKRIFAVQIAADKNLLS